MDVYVRPLDTEDCHKEEGKYKERHHSVERDDKPLHWSEALEVTEELKEFELQEERTHSQKSIRFSYFCSSFYLHDLDVPQNDVRIEVIEVIVF